MKYLSRALDSGNVCPACPKVHSKPIYYNISTVQSISMLVILYIVIQMSNRKLIYSIDALFGLPRKKAAGVSHRRPLHGDLFFLDQNAIDEYVASRKLPRKHKDEEVIHHNIISKISIIMIMIFIIKKSQCSDFLAGNVLRSSKRYKALDETALFGVACRHEFPVAFVNLKHGER